MEDVATEHHADLGSPDQHEHLEHHEHHEAAEHSDAVPISDLRPSLAVKRSGVETDEVFFFSCPAVVGRFDASVGPVDVDLGNIPEGSYVSRKHAKVVAENGGYKIVDLGSSNGTFVLRDGEFERVDEAELIDGADVALGNARFVFHLS